ncbi:MAG: hypothetical protein HQK76_02285 [Desulfobacterales bacterium]|nr:hypothetical protein [Desulfobacterales bacterium]
MRKCLLINFIIILMFCSWGLADTVNTPNKDASSGKPEINIQKIEFDLEGNIDRFDDNELVVDDRFHYVSKLVRFRSKDDKKSLLRSNFTVGTTVRVKLNSKGEVETIWKVK